MTASSKRRSEKYCSATANWIRLSRGSSSAAFIRSARAAASLPRSPSERWAIHTRSASGNPLGLGERDRAIHLREPLGGGGRAERMHRVGEREVGIEPERLRERRHRLVEPEVVLQPRRAEERLPRLGRAGGHRHRGRGERLRRAGAVATAAGGAGGAERSEQAESARQQGRARDFAFT